MQQSDLHRTQTRGSHMNSDSLLTALVALCCIAAVGMSATTLETTLSEDPDDVINLDYEHLPLGKDDAGDVKEEVESNQGTEIGQASKENSEGNPKPSGGGEDDGESGGGAPAGQQSGGSGGTGQGMGAGLVDSLWALLESLLPLLIALVALIIAYRYRDRLRALALSLLDASPDRQVMRGDGTVNEWPSSQPQDEVRRAWLTMVTQLDLSRPQARTPLECARAAVDAGMDPEAVETVTTVFQEVRYGEQSVTDKHRERARAGLRQLNGGSP